ncbi:pentatricopeptide repeat-containing protein At2g20710, mitochondrial-like [Humulus lupulus]|uniref:pentatricopeptide repeat-containing protein At2g20710, mitochondrial-like n=1 Tax=Humulus lupulus TaxID=3486 RepID=UPI002B40F258|nr:pentatricopeptide repeat-containing protein At2g20710, mitochondrial-like [Humulus lupulus]
MSMIKLHYLIKPASFRFQYNLHNHPRAYTSLFSAKTPEIPHSSSSSYPDSLFHRVQIIRDPKASVLPVLRQWVNEGRQVDKDQLGWMVRTMRDFRRFNHALEISLWMTDSRFLKISPSDAAVRLELIHKVHGLDRAENYFNNMSRKLKTHHVYAALLRSYVRENSVDKAEALMEEIRNLGEAVSSLPYNVLINLYAKNGNFDKIDMLMQEMKVKGIPHDKYTLRNRLSAYVAASDIAGMEKIMNRMEEEPNLYVNWKVYALAASGYLKVGLIKEALKMLGKLERDIDKINPKTQKTGHMFLLTLYSNTGNREELYRIWNKYKPTYRPTEAPYACMIRCLSKFDDIEGAEKVFKEWESQCSIYDFRVVNSILIAYCRKGLLEKAESTLKAAAEGSTPYAGSWSILANGFVENNQMPRAVEMLKKSLMIGRKGWMSNPVTLAACLDYLKDQGDVTGMEEIINLLRNSDVFSKDTFDRLLSTCDAAGESFSGVLCPNVNGSNDGAETNQINTDGFSFDEETNEILGTR